MRFRYRWVMLIVYAISPILVHGTELGRPDHQSLSILLVTIAICAEWSSQEKTPRNVFTAASTDHDSWSIVSGIAWAFAIWNSGYESLVLFQVVNVVGVLAGRMDLLAKLR